MRDLVIFGVGDTAELARFYFERDTHYRVVAYALDQAFIEADTFDGLPVIPFETLPQVFPPSEVDCFVALGYSGLNQLRKSKYFAVKEQGYNLPSYVSPDASIMSADIGDNCFVLEGNVLQKGVSIGVNVTLWSGNHIGHHTIVGDHAFIASHAVISGRVSIGSACFLGVNATVRDHVIIGDRCLIGAGSLILGHCEPDGLYVGNATDRSKVPSSRMKTI